MRTVPLLFLTLALSATADDPAETGGDGWTRPNDREPADDWSERTGIPSPFPCRADMVWCEAERAMPCNPDGSDRGAWVPSAAWREVTEPGPGDEPIPDPTDGEPLWAYVARLSRDERFLSWPDDPNGDPVHPLHVYRLVDGRFILVPPDAPPGADDSY